ncbi:uncharacterized protein [Argopecten irradians]|uniref:uncharacterized protein n=1 Tax=Argopecten irradians TaxID=31199 RepID=UPI0037174F30
MLLNERTPTEDSAMDALIHNVGHSGQLGLGQVSVGQLAGSGLNFGQVTYEELHRPAKELSREVLYQLSLKLQNTTRGNWASLAEVLGYARDKIDEFDHQSAAEYKPPGYLVLRDWTKQERGRSIYVLLESLKQCGRLDCVVFLEQEVKNLLSMKLHLKITDETNPSNTVKPYFLTVPTRCQATLKDSLENVFGGELQDYQICASWMDRAHRFKGMHLSVRRTKRSSKETSMVSYPECSIYENQGRQNNLSEPNHQLKGHHKNVYPDKDFNNGERNILGDYCEGEISPVTNTHAGDHKLCLEDCPGHKDYVSEECLYCGKFRTFTQKIFHTTLSKESNNGTLRKIQSGLHCRSCTCDLSMIGNTGSEQSVLAPHRADGRCFMTKQEFETTKRKLSADSDNENVVSSTTDMDVDDVKRLGNYDSETGKTSSEDTSGYTSNDRAVSPKHCSEFVDDQEQTFLKAPYHSQTHCKLVRVVTENITVENDTENMLAVRPREMNRSISDSAGCYQRLNRETMTYRETNVGPFTFDNVHAIPGHNLGTIGDVFSPHHRSPIEHCDNSEDGFKSRGMLSSYIDMQQKAASRGSVQKQYRTSNMDITIAGKDREDTVTSEFSAENTNTMPDHRDNTPARLTQMMETVSPTQDNNTERCPRISSSRHDTPPTLPPRNNRPTPYPSKSGGAESKFIHLNKALWRYPEWSPRGNENTVENKMRRYINVDGHYLLWYMTSTKTLVLTVSHLRKLIHYAIYMTQENGELSYFIFKGETFPDLDKLLYHYKHNGLKPQSLQGGKSRSFLQQQNTRGSRQMARLSHVELLHPVTQPRGRTSV